MPTFTDLPGELLLRIVGFAVLPDNPSREDLVKYVRRSRPLQLVNKQFKAAVDRVVGLHFHAFRPALPYALKVYAGPWHPAVLASVQVHRCYWQWHQGHHTRIGPDLKFAQKALTLARLPYLRTISLDLRAQEPFTQSSLRLWKTKHAPRWVHASAILTHLLVSATSIEDLVIRLSPQQELLDFVVELISKNKSLVRIQIDVDSAVVNGRNLRPTIHLDRVTSPAVPYAAVKRFIVRAPSCDIRFFHMVDAHPPFYKRLAAAEEISISCCNFSTNIPNPLWIATLLRATPAAHVFEICIERPDDFDVSGFGADDRPIHLPQLYELGVQVPDVDTSLLRLLRAPELYAFRFHTSVPVTQWARLLPDHFPALFIAQLSANGPSADRLRNLGVPMHKCAQNLQGHHNFTTSHCRVLNAFIKPYDRPRPRAVVPFSQAFLDSLQDVLPSDVQDDSSDDDTLTTLSSLDDSVSGSAGDTPSLPVDATATTTSLSEPADITGSTLPPQHPSPSLSPATVGNSPAFDVELGFAAVIASLIPTSDAEGTSTVPTAPVTTPLRLASPSAPVHVNTPPNTSCSASPTSASVSATERSLGNALPTVTPPPTPFGVGSSSASVRHSVAHGGAFPLPTTPSPSERPVKRPRC
ncbi:hypothetical protein OC834_005832 [Tilletia horrida]|nr:hypothetical protein OC834_005832 [Tilletia horrida]